MTYCLCCLTLLRPKSIPLSITSRYNNLSSYINEFWYGLNAGSSKFEYSSPEQKHRSSQTPVSLAFHNEMAEGYKILDSTSYTSTIYSLPGSPPRVCKSFNSPCISTHFPTGKAAYERFSQHNPPSNILKYHGIHNILPSGIILSLAENGNLHKYLWD